RSTRDGSSDVCSSDLGKSPKGFSFALTGQGKPGVWIVNKDDQAHRNVLMQTDADKTDYRFPVAVYDSFASKDVDVSVQFKALSEIGRASCRERVWFEV